MTLDDLLGRRVRMRIDALEPAGAWLVGEALGAGDEVLLPAREVPPDASVGDVLFVAVYLDSEDRTVATTLTPKLTLGEVRFLAVTAITDIGAFVDWGLGKELLVPFAEQSRDLFVGEVHPIGLYLDKSGRLAGTMFVGDMLGDAPRAVKRGDWFEGEAWRNDPDIGLFAILERRYLGLVPAAEPHRLRRGEVAKFRVAQVLPDGKLVLSLRQHAYQELEGDAEKVLEVLGRPDAPPIGDWMEPDRIRDLFGLSKKAFKRAVGRLLKQGAIELDEAGNVAAVARADPPPPQ